MRSKQTFLLVLLIALLLPATAALAQTESPLLDLRLRRDWGYGGFNNDIQGTFTIIAEGPENLATVRFLIDGALLAIDEAAPFETTFHTSSFDPGLREISATGTLADGREIGSEVLVREFLADDVVNDRMLGMLGPLLGVILVVTLLGILVPVLLTRGGDKRPVGSYSMAGGAVCRACGLPFSRHMLAPNLLAGKLERCPHCGKWQIAPRAGGDALVAAEERLRAAQSDGEDMAVELSEEERLRKQIEESRFDN